MHLCRISDTFTSPEHYLTGNDLLYLLHNCLRITIRQDWIPQSDFSGDIIHVDTNLGKTCFHFLDTALALPTFNEKAAVIKNTQKSIKKGHFWKKSDLVC